MIEFRKDHVHLRSRDPRATAQFYHRMFGAEIIESIQSDGRPRIDLELGGFYICIAQAQADQDLPHAPSTPYVGLDHFGLQVDDLEAAAAELKSRGVEFFSEPRVLRPGLKIAFVKAPDDVRIELVERGEP